MTHCLDGPAECTWIVQPDGERVLEAEYWSVRGVAHRLDGPCTRTWHEGLLDMEEWRNHGRLHRLDGPARRIWRNGILLCEEYYVDGVPHRMDGPSTRAKNTTLWHLYGRPYTEKEYRVYHTKRRRLVREALEANRSYFYGLEDLVLGFD